ncbi:MAG: hypothetical protein EPGJADBJ_04493 [Saprospiraceae bacterium]|nr:hypothetical protein [Saprospiraceae bacterium]
MRYKLIFIFAACATLSLAQVTKIDPARMLEPGANSTFLTTDGSGNAIWGNAATLLTGGTGISISGNTVSVNNIPETSIEDGSLLARVGGNETITGNWDFSSNLTRLKDVGTYLYDDGDGTKTLRFQLSGISTGTTINLTVPNGDGIIARTTDLWGATVGGTGQTSVTQGDLLYGSAANTWSRLAKNTSSTRYLANTGTSNNPAWAQVDLSNGVTGDLPFSNLAQIAGLSILGRSANSTGDMAAITGTVQTAPQVRGTTLGFYPIPSKTFFTTVSTLPTSNLETVEIGVLTHNENGRTAFVEIDVIIAVSGISCLRKYIYPATFNHTNNGSWVRLAPFFSNGKYVNEDFELEVKNCCSNSSPTYAYDTLRIVRTSGTVAGSADVVIQFYGSNVDGNDFTATSANGISTSPGMHQLQAFSQVKQSVGINTPNPVANLDVYGTGSTNATTGLSVKNLTGTQSLLVSNDATSAFGGALVSSYRLAVHGALTTQAGNVRATGTGAVSALTSASVALENTTGGSANKWTMTSTDAGHLRIYINNTLLTTQIRGSNLEMRHWGTGLFGAGSSTIEGAGLVFTDTTTADAVTGAENKLANSSADAVLYAKAAASGGDAKLKLHTGSNLWSIGSDASDGGRVKIAPSDDPGSGNVVSIGANDWQFNAQFFSNKFALTDGATIAVNWNNGNTQSVTLGGNRTFTFANPKSGAQYQIYIKQDGTGSRTVTWPTIKWAGGSAPTLTTTAGKTDIITITYDGNDYFGSASLNY